MRSVRTYDPIAAGVDSDLTVRMGPIGPVVKRRDPLVRRAIGLGPEEFNDLLAFVREGLLDPRALPQNLCDLVPLTVPSGLPVLVFERCQ